MRFTFLGTSAGMPTRLRGLSAVGLEFDQDNKWYLFDCGEGTQIQLLKSRLRIGKLEAIFITHLHGDHFYGLPGLLSSKKMDNALRPLTIYGPKGIKKFLECTFDVSQTHLGYALTIIEYDDYDKFVFDKFLVTVVPVVHSIKSVAFYIQENDTSNKLNEEKLRAIGLEPSPLYGELKRGKVITHKGRLLDPKEYMLEPIRGTRAIISGDNARPEVLGKYLQDLDLLIHETTYTQDVYDNLAEKVLHTTARELAIVSEKFGIHNLIATHISPRYHKNGKYDISLLYDEIKTYYSGKAFIANDFDEFYIRRSDYLVTLA